AVLGHDPEQVNPGVEGKRLDAQDFAASDENMQGSAASALKKFSSAPEQVNRVLCRLSRESNRHGRPCVGGDSSGSRGKGAGERNGCAKDFPFVLTKLSRAARDTRRGAQKIRAVLGRAFGNLRRDFENGAQGVRVRDVA